MFEGKLNSDRWQGFCKLFLGVCTLLLYCCEHVKGTVLSRSVSVQSLVNTSQVFLIHPFRSGGHISLGGGSSLPGWRPTGADMHHIWNISKMVIHCSIWKWTSYDLFAYSVICRLLWCGLRTSDNQLYHDHFLKTLQSKQLATGIQDGN